MRRANSAREPRGATLAYSKFLTGRLDVFEGHIRRLLFPVLDEMIASPGATSLPDEPDARVRVDARIPASVLARLSALELRLLEVFDEADLEDALNVIGRRVAAHNKTELLRVIGVSIRTADPGVAAQIGNFRALNVSRIKSLVGTELVEITQLLERSEATAARVEVLRAAIEERFDVARSRASLLARDQTLTLNAQITRTRMQNAGVDSYIWTTSGDDRVRETHAELDGETFRWDTPPQISDDGRRGHPGDDFQCRCTAFPVLPELA